MKVQIDTREKNRITSATKYFEEQGLEVTVEELPIGDYIFNNKVVFEFKLISDFIASIQDNRVFNQAINQSQNFDYHFVIIHGDLATRSKCISMTKHYRPVNIFQYIGAISSLNRYTTVIETYSPYLNESYYRMMTQARKCLQDKPIVKKFPKKHKNAAFNYLCYCVYGINAKKAQRIVEHNKLDTLNDLMQLTIEDLTSIEGIGEKTAQTIIGAIH